MLIALSPLSTILVGPLLLAYGPIWLVSSRSPSSTIRCSSDVRRSRVSLSAVTNISTSASVFIPRPREEVFRFATDSTNAPRTIRSRRPFAGISKIEMHQGQSLAKGSKRRIFMTDGAILEEDILAYDPPVRHRYGWAGGVKPPFSLLVRSGTGNWDFAEADGGTRVVWTYTFGLTSPLAYPLAIPITWLFKGWLQQGLDALRAELLAS